MASLVTGHTELKPAPEPLRLVQAFINTRDFDYGIEDLDEPSSLTAWLQEAALIHKSVQASDTDFQTAVELREALRVLLLTNNGGEFDPQVIRELNRLADAFPLHLHFDENGQAQATEPANTVDGGLGNLLGLVLSAQSADTWRRLKACANPECRWIFYDASKNLVGSWCRMSTCGNRAKSKTHRERQKRSRESKD